MKKIVIEIDDDLYNEILSRKYSKTRLEKAVANGTVLPEHHGRLIDYDDLISRLEEYGRKNVKYQLPYSPTIIFADKESDNNDE